LPSRGSDVDANVIAVGPMTLVDYWFCRVCQG